MLRESRVIYTFFLAAFFILGSGTGIAQNGQNAPSEVTGERIANARKEPQNWLTYFGSYDAWRFSSLNQINASNVKNLVPVWAFQTGKVEGGLNATPVVVDGIMYLIASENRVFALNAETGERLWTYNYRVPRDF